MLYKHQQDAIDFAKQNNGRVAIFHDCGLGKTRTALEIFKHYRQSNPALRMLICCPLSLIKAAWGEDTRKFTDFTYQPYVDVEPGERPDIMGINYESLISKKRFDEIYRIMLSGTWMLVCDEGSKLKSHKSMTTKALLKLAPLATYKIVASGTPAPNSEMEFWAQAKFVRSDCFPDSFYAFRNQYFHLGRGNQTMKMQGQVMSRGMMAKIFQNGWKYMITPANREALLRRMAPFCHWVRKEDALDLPEKIDEIRLVRLNPNEQKAYNEMKTHLVAEIKTGRQRHGSQEVAQITAEVALAKIMKLRQIAAGFAYDEHHNAHHPGKSSKMRELEDLLEELGNQQVIIWVQFHEEVRVIQEMLAGKTVTTLYADTPDKDASIKAFQDGTAQYLIAHPRSAAHGLTFVNCSAAVYFSLDYSYEAYQQSRDRIHRIGQTKKCLYVHLVADKTIDGMVMDVLQRKKSLQDIFYQLTKEEA